MWESSESLPVGLIGAGRWGRNYLNTIAQIRGFKLLKVCSRNPGISSWVPPGTEIVQNWQAVIDDPRLGGVIIATPPDLHSPILEAAILKDLPAIVEKPLTLSPVQAQDLAALAKKRNSKILVDHIYLFHPGYQKLKAELEQLADKRITHLQSYGGNYGPFRNYSSLWDYGPHDLALCLDLLKESPHVEWAVETETQEVEGKKASNYRIKLSFRSGANAETHFGNFFPERVRKLEVGASQKSFVFDGSRPLTSGESLPLEHLLQEFKHGVLNQPTERFGLALGVQIVEILGECQQLLTR